MVTQENQHRNDCASQGVSNPVPVSRNQPAGSGDPAELNGIIVVDKPGDMSSAKVVANVKRILNVKRVGHTGTLDPFANGVLVCCVNRATKLARFLLHGDKKYIATLKLGEKTDTQDSTGTIVAVSREVNPSEEAIHAVFNQFKGAIEQLPPVYSALKHKGVPLYKLARRGQPIQKPPRQVYISDIKIREIDIPFIEFEITCSAGTYIRTLCADIGNALGCGGHLQALQRTESSGFTIDQAFTLTDLEELKSAGTVTNVMISMADALHSIPAHIADRQLIEKIRHGMDVTPTEVTGGQHTDGINNSQPYIKIVDSGDNLIAVLEYPKGKGRLNYCCVLSPW
jgi:tRNA pseudouridine55 synthase